jgi:lipoic acid synthetase
VNNERGATSANPPKPPWLTRRALTVNDWERMKSMLDGLSLSTICEQAECPNIGECFRQRTATFLILGRACTRNCRFCAVEHGKPAPVDSQEPHHLAQAVHQLDLSHVVITSVTRDDLADGGAGHFAACVAAVHKSASATIEVLAPDFQGDEAALSMVLDSHPEVFGHNIEVVPRLYSLIRSRASYERSLRLLKRAKELQADILVKSGLMVGVGETEQEVLDVLCDLRAVDCDLVTIGQYLRPSVTHYPVVAYVSPEAFDRFAQAARRMGFRGVMCGPFVRSSFHAGELLDAAARQS